MYSIIKSGMASAMHELSVISNNVSNANSNGFKKSLVSFADFAGGLFPVLCSKLCQWFRFQG